MKRLTKKLGNGYGPILRCEETRPQPDVDCLDCAELRKVVERLEAYEDTGLEPEEVEMHKTVLDMRQPRPLLVNTETWEDPLICSRCRSGEYLYNQDGNRQRVCGWCGQAIGWIV